MTSAKESAWTPKKLSQISSKISLNKLKIKQRDYLSIGSYPVVDQGHDLISGYFNDSTLLIPNEPPFIVFGDHTKTKKFIPFKFIPGADGVKVLKAKDDIDPRFLFYLLHTIKIEDKGYARHFQFLEKATFLVPPLPTQQAIVAKLEALFSELDKGIEQLKTAQQQLRTYRQAVLNAAFENITARISLEDCCISIVDCLHSTAKFRPIGYFCIDTTCMIDGRILFEKARFVDEETFFQRTSRLTPQENDILFAREGTVGTCAIVPPGVQLCLGQRMMMFRLKENILPKYFLYFLQSPIIRSEYKPLIGGTTSPHLNIRDIRKLNILLPDLDTQIAVVALIESRLSVADKLEETIAENLKHAEALRQSILKKAFEGELVS